MRARPSLVLCSLAATLLGGCIPGSTLVNELTTEQWVTLCDADTKDAVATSYQCDGMDAPVDMPAPTSAMCQATFDLRYSAECTATVDDWRACRELVAAIDPCDPPTASFPECDAIITCMPSPST